MSQNNNKTEKDLCILINGNIRLPIDVIINCIENYKRQFEWMSVDTWIFTWKTDNGIENKLIPHCHKLITNEYSPSDEQLDSKNIPFTQQLNANPEHKICRISHYSTFYGLDSLFKEIEKSDITYKYSLRARNDIEIDFNNQQNWLNIIESNPNGYITPQMNWSPVGINDHIGFGTYNTVKNIWSYDENHFKDVLTKCWNFEVYVQQRLDLFGIQNIKLPVEKYIVKRTGRVYNDGTPMHDWNLK